jgi:hypothetical protein
LVEHATENRSVGGSIPPLGTIGLYFYLAIFLFLAHGAAGLFNATAALFPARDTGHSVVLP